MARAPPYSPQSRSNARIIRTYESRSFFSSSRGDMSSLMRSCFDTLKCNLLRRSWFLLPSFSTTSFFFFFFDVFLRLQLTPAQKRDDDVEDEELDLIRPVVVCCCCCSSWPPWISFSYARPLSTKRIRDRAGPNANTLFLPMSTTIQEKKSQAKFTTNLHDCCSKAWIPQLQPAQSSTRIRLEIGSKASNLAQYELQRQLIHSFLWTNRLVLRPAATSTTSLPASFCHSFFTTN